MCFIFWRSLICRWSCRIFLSNLQVYNYPEMTTVGDSGLGMFRGCFSKKPKETSGDFKGGNFGELRAKHLGSQSTRWLAQQTHFWVILWNPARFKDVHITVCGLPPGSSPNAKVEDLRDQMMLKGIPIHYPASEEFSLFFLTPGKKHRWTCLWRPHFDQDYKSHPGGRWWCHFFFIYPDPWGDDPILTCAIFFKRVGSTIN